MKISKEEFKVNLQEVVKDSLGSDFDIDSLDYLFEEEGGEIEFGILAEALIKKYVEKEDHY